MKAICDSRDKELCPTDCQHINVHDGHEGGISCMFRELCITRNIMVRCIEVMGEDDYEDY